MPLLSSTGGAGLGNEAIAWGKAIIGAAELGLVECHPPWALNRRGYRGDFGTSRLDWVGQRALRALFPTVEITKADVLASEAFDYAEVIRSLRSQIDRRGPVVLLHGSGMTGGFLSIFSARQALTARLRAPSFVGRDLVRIAQAQDESRVLIGVHVRGGDFLPGPPAPGEFNRRLPTSWYASVVSATCDALGADRVEVAIIGDETDATRCSEIAGRASVLQLPPRSRPLLSDLAVLASADLLICSVSSFSLLAAFLGDRHYAWYGPHLTEVGGWRAIWAPSTDSDGARTALANTFVADSLDLGMPRGVAMADGDPLPPHVITELEVSLARRDRRTDLVHFGVVR
jgi:hypothetical protein